MDITYWSDYACPYCYIAEKRLKAVIKALGIEDKVQLNMKAFQLDPHAPQHAETTTVARFAQKYGISDQQATQQIERISQLGKDEGIDFNYATTLFTNTFNAHRLTKYAANHLAKADFELFKSNLYAAYFTENKELAQEDVLVDVALKSGLNSEEVRAFLQSDLFSEEVTSDLQEAHQRGIQGVPYFIINDTAVIPGAQPKAILLQTIANIAIEEGVSNDLSGQACGIDGC